MDVDSDHNEEMIDAYFGENGGNSISDLAQMRQNEPNTFDAHPLLVAPDQESPSHILMALNDHCLYEAFKRLHFLDLLNVSKVCVRFETQAKAAFASKYKELELDIVQCDQGTMENILCVFGSSIRSLHIYSNENPADGNLFRAIIKNCSSGIEADTGLEKLKLFNMKIEVDSPNLRLPFPKLEHLRLGNFSGNLHLSHLIDDCTELREIYMERCHLKGLNEMINRRFEKLEKLGIYMNKYKFNDEALEHFIVSNPKLIKLSITPATLRTSRAIRLIGENMMELRELSLSLRLPKMHEMNDSDVGMIGQLRSLKELHFSFDWLDVAPLAKSLATNKVPIEKFYVLCGCIDNNAIKYISQLQRIKSLNMLWLFGLNGEHLVDLCKNLTELQDIELEDVKDENGDYALTVDDLIQMLQYAKNLSRLSLTNSTDFTINMDDYEIILDIVRNRPGKIELRIVVLSNKSELNVPEAILQEHADILSIKMYGRKMIYYNEVSTEEENE